MMTTPALKCIDGDADDVLLHQRKFMEKFLLTLEEAIEAQRCIELTERALYHMFYLKSLGRAILYVFFKFICRQLWLFGGWGCTELLADWQTDINRGFGFQFLAGHGMYVVNPYCKVSAKKFMRKMLWNWPLMFVIRLFLIALISLHCCLAYWQIGRDILIRIFVAFFYQKQI